MRFHEVNPGKLLALRGKRSREFIAHELRKKGHGTDAKALWRYETGRNQPNARILPDYAEVLGAASVDELYESDEDEEAALEPSASEPRLNKDEWAMYGQLTARALRASQPQAERAPKVVA